MPSEIWWVKVITETESAKKVQQNIIDAIVDNWQELRVEICRA